MQNKIIIFCDGSSRGNPGPGGWGAIICENGKVTEIGAADTHTTNNKMELQGAITALRFVKNLKDEIILNTDSSYIIGGMTEWIFNWQKNNWKNSAKKPVLNRDLWEKLIEAAKGKKIKWNHVAGHAGVPGNERCDEIATSFADGEKPKLFNGNVSDYKIKILDK
jgi:ribonuclease HI